MPTDQAAIIAIPLLTAAIEGFKRAGLPARYAPLAAMGLGMLLTTGAYLSTQAGAHDLYEAMLQGLMLGLSACGLYSAAGTLRSSGAIAKTRARGKLA